MNILILNEKCGFFGGVEQNVFDTANGLSQKGHQVSLGYVEVARDVEHYSSAFYQVHQCREVGSQSGETLNNIIRNSKADIVYVHKIPSLPDLKDISVPLVRMVHDHDLCCPRKHKYLIHNQHVCNHPFGWRCVLDLAWLERNRGGGLPFKFKSLTNAYQEMKANQRLPLVLVGSKFMRDELVMNGFSEQSTRILPPIINRQSVAISPVPDVASILFVGQLIRGKGVDLLLNAVKQISVPFTLTIVGDGNARASLEAQSRELGLTQNVKFAGWVSNSELAPFYQSARVVAVPSRWPEPFGMIGLEAMHYGRPVVAFKVGGIPDWCEHKTNGLLAPEQDVETFAKHLSLMIENRELAQQYGMAAFDKLQQDYSFSNYISQLEQHFHELLNGGVLK